MPLQQSVRSLAICLAVLASPAGAMTEEELQRCVWSCLANFGPNTNPAYHTCVEDHCVPENGPPATATEPSKPSATTVSSRWSAGTTFDGKAQYAGLADADGASGFYYLCDRQGRSEIMLTGLQGAGATMSLIVDGTGFRHPFEKQSGGHSASLPGDDPLIAALSRGSAVEVQNPSGATVMRFGLRGSSKALASAIESCR